MLIPDNGASKTMEAATKRPAQMPVSGAILGVFETRNTTDIRQNEIASSARNATAGPMAPGTVAT